MSTPDQVLSAFIDEWNAGRRPRTMEYLRRVPDGRDREQLADQITAWLELAPTPDYDEEARSAIRAEPAVAALLENADADAGLWPATVPRLRARAGLTTQDLAVRLVERFSLGEAGTERTADYLQRLERGELEPSRVSRRLLDALGGLLGVPGSALADAGTFGRGLRPAAAGGTFFRAAPRKEAGITEDIEALSHAAMTPAPPALDELDRLFIGGPDA